MLSHNIFKCSVILIKRFNHENNILPCQGTHAFFLRYDSDSNAYILQCITDLPCNGRYKSCPRSQWNPVWLSRSSLGPPVRLRDAWGPLGKFVYRALPSRLRYKQISLSSGGQDGRTLEMEYNSGVPLIVDCIATNSIPQGIYRFWGWVKTELQNVNTFTRSKTVEPNFNRREVCKSQQFWHLNWTKLTTWILFGEQL